MKTTLVNLKLKSKKYAKATIKRLQKLDGVIKIELLLPDEGDSELATLYVVEADIEKVDQVIRQMLSDPAVQYAEGAPKRRLIKKQKPC